MYIIENIFFGGGERVFSQIIKGLNKEKYKIYVACKPGGVFEEKIGSLAEIIPFSLRNGCSLLKILRLSRIVKEKSIDIIHSQGSRADFFARVVARIAKVPVVISTIAMPPEGYDVGILKKIPYVFLDRLTEKITDCFIVVSQNLQSRLITKHKIPKEKVVTIYNGVEIEEFKSESLPIQRIRDEYKISQETVLIGVIGRLVWQKGIVYFIQAIRKIVNQKPPLSSEVKFLIIGEGLLKKKLKKIVRRFHLNNYVIFTNFRKDVKELLHCLDIVVLSSIREGQPIVLLEAMAMQKAIIATDIQGINETVVNDESGILVRPKDVAGLAEAIVELVNNREKAHQLGEMARKTAQGIFNFKDKLMQYENLYQELVSRKIKRPHE